jgi:MSHA biogenesis protein MshE
MSFISLLIKKNIIDSDTAAVLEKKSADTGQSLELLLHDNGIKQEQILQAKAEFLGVDPYFLLDKTIPYEILNYIPEDSARHYKFIPLEIKEGVLYVGITDPDNIAARDALNFITAKNNIVYKLFLMSEEDYNRAVEMYKGLTGEVTQALTDLKRNLVI